MEDFILEYYLWIKSLHIIAVISWMAGLLYLPRLFIYHCDAEIGSDKSETFKIMEKKLVRIIMNPAMVIAWVMGCLMLYANTAIFEDAWIHVKLTAIVLMTIMHHVFSMARKKFEKDENKRSAKFFRIVNEVPAVLMIIIVIMVIVRPF